METRENDLRSLARTAKVTGWFASLLCLTATVFVAVSIHKACSSNDVATPAAEKTAVDQVNRKTEGSGVRYESGAASQPTADTPENAHKHDAIAAAGSGFSGSAAKGVKTETVQQWDPASTLAIARAELGSIGSAIEHHRFRFDALPVSIKAAADKLKVTLWELDPWGQPWHYTVTSSVEPFGFTLTSSGPSIEDPADDLIWDREGGKVK